MENLLFHKYISSPLGYLRLTSNYSSLLSISFIEKTEKNSLSFPEILCETEKQLTQYFEGKRKEFDLNLYLQGTVFQQKVWQLVKKIEFGQTESYLKIAIKTGSDKNTRAVGMANGKNPIPIIIPCHRIIGVNGKLTGYAGGLQNKRWLLQHEINSSRNPLLLF